jgi:predicted metal-dependent phosphoesterase TrpH
MKFDLHLHTSRHSPDSDIDPFELLNRARGAGLDGVVITEHGYLWPEDELAELRATAPDLVVLSGIEVTGVGGDVLVYGVTNPFAVPQGIAWPDLLREVRRQGGAAVMAHPYRWGQPVDQLLAERELPFDGLERLSNNMDVELRAKAEALHGRFPHWAGLGNSDAHAPETVGVCYTEFAAEVRSNADLVAAIRAARCRPRVNRHDRVGAA